MIDYTIKLDTVALSDSDLVDFISKEFKISWNEACRKVEGVFDDGNYSISREYVNEFGGHISDEVILVSKKIFEANPTIETILYYFDN